MKDKAFSYANIFHEMHREKEFDRDSIQKFANMCPVGPILEVGAGTGRTCGYIEREHHLLEVDPDIYAKLEENSKDKPTCVPCLGGVHALPYPDDYFSGAILTFATLAELSPIVFALKEIGRVIKGEGLIYIWQPNPSSFKNKSRGLVSIDYNGEKISTSVKTRRMTQLGPYDYQTTVLARGEKQEKEYIVSQCFPDYSALCRLFDSSGLRVKESFHENPADNEIFELILEKDWSESLDFKDEVKELFNQVSDRYDSELISASLGYTDWLSSVIKKIGDTFPKILDLGCGTGYVGELIRSTGVKPFSLYGVDTSERMLDQLRKKNIYTDTVTCDLKKGLPFYRGNQFDFVFCISAFEFLPNYSSLIKEIYSVLSRGGEFVATFELATEKDPHDACFESGISKTTVAKNKIQEVLEANHFEIISLIETEGYISPSTKQKIPYLLVNARKNLL